MAINDQIIPMDRVSSVVFKDSTGNDVMSLRFAEFVEAITRQVNQNTPLTSDGSPEGVLDAEPYRFCIDTTGNVLYFKKTGAGSTGWQLL